MEENGLLTMSVGEAFTAQIEETPTDVVMTEAPNPLAPCEGCNHLRSEQQASELLAPTRCRIYMYPELQHSRLGGCPMRTHNKSEVEKDDFKLNPLKAAKRGVKVK